MASVASTAGAPAVRMSQASLGSLGNVPNSVNLFRGEVNFPLSLVSLQGRNGLDVAVSAFYGSHVHAQVTTWNMTAETGVLGVGWSIPFERVMVVNQSTGSNLDDTFYLVTGGAPKELVQTGVDGDVMIFELLDYQFWQIRYHPNAATPAEEYWEIVREDGQIYTYGLQGIQWGIRWNNWIGSTTLANGQQYPVAWNLVKVATPQGDAISFAYENDDYPIGWQSSPVYTRSSRLSQVVDVYGQKVAFHYEAKEAFEVQPPEVPPSPTQPNAFQYQQEPKYLDSVEVSNPQGELLLRTKLAYEFLNVAPYPQSKDDHYKKRYLTAVTQSDALGNSMPPIAFDYWSDAADVHPGALKQVLYPQGGLVTYQYESKPLMNSATRQVITSPGSGYEPKVWHGPQYTIVTWENDAARSLVTQIYSWGGSWNRWQDTRNWNIAPGTLRVSPGNGFFAVWYQDASTKAYQIYLFRANPYAFGQWNTVPYSITFGTPPTSPVIAVGNDYVAVVDQAAGQLKLVTWNVELGQWAESAFSTSKADHVTVAAGQGHCVAAYYTQSSQNLQLSLYDCDPKGRWQQRDTYNETVAIDWAYTTPESLLSQAPSFIVATFIKSVDQTSNLASYGVRILTWGTDDRFGFPLKRDYSQELDVENPVGFSVVQDSTVGNAQHLLRFDGAQWQAPGQTIDPVAGKQYAYAYGSDSAVFAVTGNATVTYTGYDYSPYDGTWRSSTPDNGGNNSVSSATFGTDYRTVGRSIAYRDSRRIWNAISTLPSSADLTTVQNRGPYYIAYQETSGGASDILLLHDGAVKGTQTLTGERIFVPKAAAGQYLAGPDSFVTYQGTDFTTATNLFLYQIVGASLEAHQVDYSVSELDISDGYTTLSAYFQYDRNTATYDPSGRIAQFVTVSETQGDREGTEGRVEHIYFNGLSPDVPGVVYPPSDAFTNARAYFSRLNGQLFRDTVFNGAGRPVQVMENYLYTYSRDNSDYKMVGTITRQRKTLNASSHYLLDVDPSYAAALQKRTVPSGLLDRLADAGFALPTPLKVEVLVDQAVWTIADGSGKVYQAALADGDLSLFTWFEGVTELEYNAKGQLARTILSNYDSEGQAERLQGETTYAWEVYPEFETANVLAPSATVTSKNLTHDVVTDISKTTYKKNWSSTNKEVWSPWQTLVWTGNGTAAGNDLTWMKTTEILDVTDAGLAITTADVGGFRGGVLFDREKRFAVAALSNSDPADRQALYYGFESYEDPRGWALTPSGLAWETYVGAGDAFTGNDRLAIPGDPNQRVGLANSLDSVAPGKYLLTCRMKTTPDFVEDASLAAWEVGLTGGSGVNQTLTTAIPNTDGRWQFLSILIDPEAVLGEPATTISLEVFSQQNGQALLVDDIFVVPLSAQCRATVYDTYDMSPWATLDYLGSVQRTVKDYLRRPVAEVGNDGIPRSLLADYQWRQSGDTFDPADPSASVVVGARGLGFFSDFHHGDEWKSQWQASAGWSLEDHRLVYGGTGTGTLTSIDFAPVANYGVRFLLGKPSAVAGSLGIRFGSAFTVQWVAGNWQLLDADGAVVDSFAQATMDSQDLLLIATNHSVLFYANGRLTLRHVFEGELTGSVKFFTDDPLTFDAILGFSDPIVGMTYTDSVGRPLQTQSLNDDQITVGATGYDTLGRAYYGTKEVRFDATLFGYRPAFTAALDANDGSMGDCELTQAYPDDQGYPFSRTRFETSPLSRPVEQSGFGKVLAIDLSVPVAERHTTRMAYGLNVADSRWADLPAGQYVVTASVDPDGTPSRTLADRFGRTVVAWVGNPDDPTQSAVSRSYFDVYGNLARTLQPNAYDPGVADAEKFKIEWTHDFMGSVLSATTPDTDSAAQSVYDSPGRLRFYVEANGTAGGYLNYRRYDGIGRLVEQGTCQTAWNRDELQAHADDAVWLPSAGLWTQRFEYDGDGHDLNTIGRVSRSQVGKGDGSPDVTSETTFVYDRRGLITSKTLTVPDYDEGKPHTTGFRYDVAGNLIQVTYDAEAGESAFTVHYVRDGYNRITEIDSQVGGQAPVAIASYVYGANGGVATETLRPNSAQELPRQYAYYPEGWLKSVSDAFVSETMSYTSGGYQDTGYYTGKVALATSEISGVGETGFVASYRYQFAYDALGRLQVAATDAGDEWSYGTQRELSYDANTNLTQFERGGQDQTYAYQSGTNRLRDTDGGAGDAYGYDADGNQTSLPPLGIGAIQFDRISGLPNSVERTVGGATQTLELKYDADGSRILKSSEGRRRLYVSDPAGVPLLLRDTVDTVETVSYLVYGPNGLIAVSHDGNAYPVLRGRQGSTRAVIDGTNVAGAYNYLPTGEFLGAAYENDLPFDAPYLFTGQELDRETSLYNFRARFYDPAVARFISRDPAGQFPSPYSFGGGDPVNSVDPSGNFSWSWAAFGAVVGGILAIAGGIALTIATAGAATPFMIAGVVGGGMLIGAGLGSAAYGFTHADADKSKFEVVEWGISIGLGAAFGGLAAGIGLATAGIGLGVVAGLAVETLIGLGLGAVDGYVTNGSLNSYNNVDFNSGWLSATLTGAAFGAVGGAIGGVLGRGSMLRTNRVVNAARSGGRTGRLALATQNTTDSIWHSVVGTRRGTSWAFTDLRTDFGDVISKPRILRGGQDTEIAYTRGIRDVRDWVSDNGRHWTTSMSEVELPEANMLTARNYARNAADTGGHGPFNFLTNGCTAWARDVMRVGGVEPPLWAQNSTALEFWLRTLGQRTYKAD